MSDMYAVICTDGEIVVDDIYSECRPGKWVPIFVIKEDQKTIVPIFNETKIARTFASRNIPKSHFKPLISLIPENLEWIKNQGWEIKEMTYPNKIKTEIGWEILPLTEEPGILRG